MIYTLPMHPCLEANGYILLFISLTVSSALPLHCEDWYFSRVQYASLGVCICAALHLHLCISLQKCTTLHVQSCIPNLKHNRRLRSDAQDLSIRSKSNYCVTQTSCLVIMVLTGWRDLQRLSRFRRSIVVYLIC